MLEDAPDSTTESEAKPEKAEKISEKIDKFKQKIEEVQRREREEEERENKEKGDFCNKPVIIKINGSAKLLIS